MKLRKFQYFLVFSLFVALATSVNAQAATTSKPTASPRITTWTVVTVRHLGSIPNTLGMTDMKTICFRSDCPVSVASKSGTWDKDVARGEPMFGPKAMNGLMSHFNVTREQDLVGKSFQCTQDDCNEAVELLLLQIKTSNHYTPVPPHRIFELAAHALAQMEVPDWRNIFSGDVGNAFQGIFDDNRQGSCEINTAWVLNFSKKVNEYSKGQVALIPSNWQISDMDGNFATFILKGHGKTIHVTIQQSSEPIVFHYF